MELTFKIKLLKEIPNKNAVAIGPNIKLLHPQKENIPPEFSVTRPPPPIVSSVGSLSTLFQPTIPDGPPRSSDLILSLANASLEAFREINDTR